MRITFTICMLCILYLVKSQSCDRDKHVFNMGLPDCERGDYRLIFSDEFTGNTLDRTKWDVTYPWGRKLYTKDYEIQLYFEENIEVSNGTLKLIAREEVRQGHASFTHGATEVLQDGQQNLRWVDFTSGMIYSKNTFYTGKYEFRFRTNQGNGKWPAAWLYGGTYYNELDFIDNLKGPSDLTYAVYHDHDHDGNNDKCDNTIESLVNFAEWHIVTVTFTTDLIMWEVDGVVVGFIPRWAAMDGCSAPLIDRT